MSQRSKRLWSYCQKMSQRSRNVFEVTARRCHNVAGTSLKLLPEDVTTFRKIVLENAGQRTLLHPPTPTPQMCKSDNCLAPPRRHLKHHTKISHISMHITQSHKSIYITQSPNHCLWITPKSLKIPASFHLLQLGPALSRIHAPSDVLTRGMGSGLNQTFLEAIGKA